MIENEGIIIKSVNYGDSSKIITLFTKEGIKSLNVKGAQKPTSHTFNLAKEFTLIAYEDRGKTLIGGRVEKYYANIEMDLSITKSVLRIFEIVSTLAEHITDYPICYGFIKDALDAINNKTDCKLIELVFRIKFLYLVGLAPNFKSCVACGKTEGLVYFSLYDGGMKCNDCKNINDFSLTEADYSSFKLLYLLKFDKMLENSENIKYDYESLNKMLDIFYNHFLGFDSKVERIYRKL